MLGVSMLDGFLNIAHVKVYSPPSVANNMFSAPLPLRARICRRIYHQEVSPWGAFHKVRVLINPCQLGNIRYIKLHWAANTILSFCLLYTFDRGSKLGSQNMGESFKSLEKCSVSLHDFFSNYNAMDELYLTSRFFSKCLISECVLSCSAIGQLSKRFSCILWMWDMTQYVPHLRVFSDLL